MPEDLAAVRITVDYVEDEAGEPDIDITAESPLPLDRPRVMGILLQAVLRVAADGRVVFTEE